MAAQLQSTLNNQMYIAYYNMHRLFIEDWISLYHLNFLNTDLSVSWKIISKIMSIFFIIYIHFENSRLSFQNKMIVLQKMIKTLLIWILFPHKINLNKYNIWKRPSAEYSAEIQLELMFIKHITSLMPSLRYKPFNSESKR